MAFTIAVSGKGGTGKTTLAALTVRHLCSRLGQTVLAVDADPNATLGAALGVEVASTIADIREDAAQTRLELAAGMSKDRQIEYLIQQSIVEQRGFDLLTMGRPEGPKCYCYVNNLLRGYLDRASGDYPFVVVDNEAGMEHLSRRTTRDVDLLLAVAEPTVVSLRSAKRVLDLSQQLSVAVKRRVTVINKAPGQPMSHATRALIDALGLDVADVFAHDPAIYEASSNGSPLSRVPDDNATLVRLGQMLCRLGVG